jgi:hypothetical protein
VHDTVDVPAGRRERFGDREIGLRRLNVPAGPQVGRERRAMEDEANLVPGGKQVARQSGAQVAGGARDKDAHVLSLGQVS